MDRALKAFRDSPLPLPVLTGLIRDELEQIRNAETIPGPDAIMQHLEAAHHRLIQSRLQPVINGTGVLIHTNLGRSPLGADAIEAMKQMAENYNNLEYDLNNGTRGGRAAYLERSLALLCQAPAAT
ncbi:MAG: hypothetical protein AAF492_31740, partial [Verrucomicrobiota bacterium]